MRKLHRQINHRQINHRVGPTHRQIDQRVRAGREQAIIGYFYGKRA
jgi:hypothetical protein